jgi:choline dehydrogenase-like flavoprotein
MRPSASDYDDWETLYKNTGWGSKDLIPLLRKIETYRVPDGGPTHGTDGPLAVSPAGFHSDIEEQFLQIARILDPDRAQKPDDADTNDLETINVYTVCVSRSTIMHDRYLSCATTLEVAQMDQWRDRNPLGCAAPYDLPSQGYPPEPPYLDGGACEAYHVRR